jgi:hypothetical protein
LFKVYRDDADACDAAEVARQGGAHALELLQPLQAGDADVEDSLFVKVQDLGVGGEGRATGDRPGGGEAVDFTEGAEAAAKRAAQ